MSVLLQPPAIAAAPTASVPLRKRTSSFSYPVDQPSPSRPPKSPRMGTSSLRRAESFILLSDPPATTAPPSSISTTPATTASAPTQGPLPYYRTLAYQKDQRMKRKGMFLNSRPVQHQQQPQQCQPALVQTPHQAVRHSLSSAQQQQRVSAPAARSTSSAIATTTSTTPISSTSTSTSSGLRPLLLSATASASTSNATSNSGHRRGPSTSSSTASYTSYTPKRPRPSPQPRAPSQVILPSISSPNPRTTIITHRTSSPLSPTPHAPLLSSSRNVNVFNAARPRPKGKHEPNLLRTAIRIRMASTPEGQRILRLGPRLALMDWEMEVAAEGMCRIDDRDLDERKSNESEGESEGKGEEGIVTKVDLPGLSKAGTRWGILEVTRDLERLVADEEMREQMMMDEVMDMALDGDGDVVMGDASVNTTPSTTSSETPALEPTDAATPTPISAPISAPMSTPSTPTPEPTPPPTPRVRLPLKRTTSMAFLPPMTTPVLTASWVVVRSEADWEMVECAA